MRPANRALSWVFVVAMVVGLNSPWAAAPVQAFVHRDTLTLGAGETRLRAAVIDPEGRYAYFGSVGRVTKVDLHTFERVGTLTLAVSPPDLVVALIDPAGEYAYFVNISAINPSLIKVDLETFTVADVLELGTAAGGSVTAGVMDPAGAHVYLATFRPRVMKVSLDTFEIADDLTLDSVPSRRPMDAAVIDPAGAFAYFGTNFRSGANTGMTNWIVKIDLDAMTVAGEIEFAFENAGVDPNRGFASAVIDHVGDHAYFGARTTLSDGTAGNSRIVKVDLTTFTPVGSVGTGGGTTDVDLSSAVIDPSGTFAIFATRQKPPRLARIDLTTFGPLDVEQIVLDDAHDGLTSAVIDPAGHFAYFGTDTIGSPARVARIDNQRIRPDARIKPRNQSGFTGTGIFTPSDAIMDQTVVANVRRTKQRVFEVDVVNIGELPDKFVVSGCKNRRGFAVRYFDPDGDVSPQVKQKSYETPVLAPGESHLIDMRIRARRVATNNFNCMVRTVSDAVPAVGDAVRARLRARG